MFGPDVTVCAPVFEPACERPCVHINQVCFKRQPGGGSVCLANSPSALTSSRPCDASCFSAAPHHLL